MLASSDTDFAMNAARSGTAGVALGKLAAQKAPDPAVKALGQEMADDYTRSTDRLRALARERKATLPSLMPAREQAAYDKLKSLSGEDFETAYLAHMLKEHQTGVKQFQLEADKGKDPIIRNFASQTLPILRNNLDKIKALSKGAGEQAK